MKRLLAPLAALLIPALLLTACGRTGKRAAPEDLSAQTVSELQTLPPATVIPQTTQAVTTAAMTSLLNTTRPATTRAATPRATTTRAATTRPVTTRPATTGPTITQPVTTKPATTHAATAASTTAAPTTTQPPTQPATDPPTTATTATQTTTAAPVTEKEALLAQINAYRAQNGASPLAADPTLDQLADVRAREQMELFSHTRPDGRPWYTVYEDHGVPRGTGYRAEDLALAQPGTAPARFLEIWQGSPTHNASILDKTYARVGIGFQTDPATNQKAAVLLLSS